MCLHVLLLFLETLQRAGRRTAEPVENIFLILLQEVPLEVGSDSLMSGPQTLIGGFF